MVATQGPLSSQGSLRALLLRVAASENYLVE